MSSTYGWLVNTKAKPGTANYRAAVNTLAGLVVHLPYNERIPAFLEFGTNFGAVWTNTRNSMLSSPFGELAGYLSLPCKVFDLPGLHMGEATDLSCIMDALVAAPNNLLEVTELPIEDCERMTEGS